MVSDSAGDAAPGTAEEAWSQLESAVRRLLDDHGETRRRLRVAEARMGELEESLHAVSSGELDPREMSEELERLRTRNRELGERLTLGREKVERILQRIDLIESERR